MTTKTNQIIDWEATKDRIISSLAVNGGRVPAFEVSRWDIRKAKTLVEGFPMFFPKWARTAKSFNCFMDEDGNWCLEEQQ